MSTAINQPEIDGPEPSQAPYTQEQILIFKVAELMLRLHEMEMAARSLLRGVRPYGMSRYQRAVLASDLEALLKATDGASSVKWPRPEEPSQ